MFNSDSSVSKSTRRRTVRRCWPLILLITVLFAGIDGRSTVHGQPKLEFSGYMADQEFASFPFQKPVIRSSIFNNKLKPRSFLSDITNNPFEFRDSLAVDDDPNNAQHWLAGSYYSVEDGLTATLMLNNKGIIPIVVQPTLYSKNGQRLDVPPVVVEVNSFRYIDLIDWINLGGNDFRQGNIRLFHTGKDLVLGAQIYLVDDSRSFSFEEKLAELGKFDSHRLEGVWIIPSKQSNVKVVLTNTSSNDLTVTGRLTVAPNITSGPQSITLAPHETKIFDMRRDFPNGGAALGGKPVALSLEHAGAKWALIARAFISERSTGYSSLAQFYNPGAGLAKEYHGAGMQMRSPSGERLKPVIVLRNTSTETAVVTGQVPYTRADGTNGSITLPATQLNANEVKLLNTNAIVQRNAQENIKFASIEVRYNTAPGSVGVAVHSESQNRDFVSRVPMWDPLKQYTPTGGYPWLIDGTSSTKNYIKNITDRTQKYVAFFTWENGGMYMIGEKEVPPHQTVEIDAKRLRDDQIPDEEGRTIPEFVSRGQFQWTLKPEDNVGPDEDPLSGLALIGRSEQIDWGRKVSNNYACQSCCTGNTVGGYIQPSSATVEVDATVTLRAYIEEESCYGFPYSHQVSASWSSNNTTIATVSGGTVTGKDLGNTSINASFSGPRYVSNPPCPPGEGPPYLAGCADNGENTDTPALRKDKQSEHVEMLAPGCGECFRAGTFYLNKSAAVSVTGTPQVDEVHPNGLVPGQSDVLVRIVGRKFGDNPTINVSGGGVTAVYNIRTPDGFEARFTVAENAQVGQRQLTVAAGGRTSNAVTFRVGDRTPVITSISRSTASTGQTFTLDISGQHFGLNPSISISPPGITCANNSATTTLINATCTVGSNTSPGTRDIRVVSRGINGTGFEQVPQQSDTSNAVPFQVTTPLPQISDVGFVEKNGLKDVTLSFGAGGTPTSGDTVKLKLERTSGTGTATFEDGSTEVTYTGTGGAPQTFRIKGVTESSQANNYKVQAEVNNSTDGQPSRDFTVAVISTLEFERINTTGTSPDVPLDNNPGNGQPNTNVGQRVFPDKNTTIDATDRATLRVKATVAPANVPNLRVYFASFDLDDPSAAGTPVDTTANDGVDNFGNVSNSKSGEFSNATGVTCANISTGAAPLHVSKIDCPVSNTTTSANFKVTMQPGDNFAVSASLIDAYRNEIRVNTSAGANLINNANQIIPISSEPNPNNVRGIRTKILTVWRRLHIEVDSMGNVTGNSATGNFAAPQTIGTGDTTLSLNVAASLKTNRFENGRLVVNGMPPMPFSVVAATPTTPANTANTVRVSNPGMPLNVTPADTFELFDDDDFNNNDGTNMIGDIGEDVTTLGNTLLQDNDTPSLNAFAPAYIRPTYDIGDNNNSTNFHLNLTDNIATRQSLYDFDQIATEASSDFWTVYLWFGYQYIVTRDEDPETDNSTVGVADDPTFTGMGQGAVIFLETNGAKECPEIPPFPTQAVFCNVHATKVHELGHIFRAQHGQGGVMDDLSLEFDPRSLVLIRSTTHP